MPSTLEILVGHQNDLPGARKSEAAVHQRIDPEDRPGRLANLVLVDDITCEQHPDLGLLGHETRSVGTYELAPQRILWSHLGPFLLAPAASNEEPREQQQAD